MTAAAAAYGRVLALGTPPPVALVLSIYWDGDALYQLAPPPFALPWDKLSWCEQHDQHASAWSPFDPPERAADELTMPDLDRDPAMQALLEALRVDRADLLEVYFEALARRLTRALGVPVLVEGIDASHGMSLLEQLRDRLTAAQFADLGRRDLLPRDRSGDIVLREWDVLLHAALPGGGIAGIHQTDAGPRLGRRLSPLLGTAGKGAPLEGPLRDVGGNPQVVGGLVPAGVVCVEVTDVFDEVHVAQLEGGVWMCVLPHGDHGGEPPVRFLDSKGSCVLSLPGPVSATAEIGDEPLLTTLYLTGDPDDHGAAESEQWEAERLEEARAVVRTARFELAWPAALRGTPKLSSWRDREDGSITSLSLRAGSAEVELGVTKYRDEVEPARSASEAFQRLLHDVESRRERARLIETAAESRIPGRWEGRDLEFTCRVGAGRWAAVAVAERRRYVVITGAGTPPDRLDLEPVRL